MSKTAFYTRFYTADTSGYEKRVLSPIYQKKKTGQALYSKQPKNDNKAVIKSGVILNLFQNLLIVLLVVVVILESQPARSVPGSVVIKSGLDTGQKPSSMTFIFTNDQLPKQ